MPHVIFFNDTATTEIYTLSLHDALPISATVASLLRGEAPAAPKLINTCYSLVAPDYGISVAGVYRPANGLLTDVEGAGGVSPADAPRSYRSAEADYAEAWFKTITNEVFG